MPDSRVLTAAVVTADMALTEQQLVLDVAERAAAAALQRARHAQDRVARCQARPTSALPNGADSCCAGAIPWLTTIADELAHAGSRD